jgi:hypothetical protein
MANDNNDTSAIKEAKQITTSMQKVRKNMEIGVLQADLAVNTLDQDVSVYISNLFNNNNKYCIYTYLIFSIILIIIYSIYTYLLIEIKGQTITAALNEHKYELKSSLHQTKLKMKRVSNLEKSEKFYSLISILFFTLCCVYIIAKRTRVLTVIYLSIYTLLYGKEMLINNKSKYIEITSLSSNLIESNDIIDLTVDFINIDNNNIDNNNYNDNYSNDLENIIKEHVDGIDIINKEYVNGIDIMNKEYVDVDIFGGFNAIEKESLTEGDVNNESFNEDNKTVHVVSQE